MFSKIIAWPRRVWIPFYLTFEVLALCLFVLTAGAAIGVVFPALYVFVLALIAGQVVYYKTFTRRYPLDTATASR